MLSNCVKEIYRGTDLRKGDADKLKRKMMQLIDNNSSCEAWVSYYSGCDL